MPQRARAALFGAAIALAGTGAAQAGEQMVYDIQLLGISLGQLYLAGEEARGSYAVEARFRSSGLMAAVSGFSAAMSVEGRVQGNAFAPLAYREDVETAQRRTWAELRYAGGVPRLTGEKQGTETAPPVDPATQAGTLDPLTPTWIVMRDQPRDGLCRMDEVLFDGARRTRITLKPVGQEGDRVRCSGRFERLAGYAPEDLAQQSTVPMVLIYEPWGEMMRLQSLRFGTPLGQVQVTRR
jgi:hypothetical protein